MSETNFENNMISEEDLEKAAGGLKITKDTLKKALLAAGALAVAGIGGYYICKNGSKKDPEKMIVKSLSEIQNDQTAAEDEFVDNYFEDDENFI